MLHSEQTERNTQAAASAGGKLAAAATTVVTAGDANFAWGTILLVASMRMNGMRQPVIAGAMGWSDEMKRRAEALGGVTLKELPKSRQCVTCQKPLLMMDDAVKTDWVCWADSDAAFVGDCTEWLSGNDPDEIVVRKYDPPPEDFTAENLEVWKRDVERFCGGANAASRYDTRVNAPFIVLHRKWKGFLETWSRQIENVLPPDVEIIMKRGSAYFQTDESVLGSLLCFLPGAPKVAERYAANGSVDANRYFAHFAYNPKPWQMWNSHSLRWSGVVAEVVDWLLDNGYAKPGELPPSLRKGWRPFWRALAPAAPWIWRATKLKRRLFGR